MTDERTKTVGMATNDEDRDWRDSMAELIEVLEHAWGLVIHLPDELEGEKANKAIEAIYDLLLAAREKALWRLARCGGLIGTELCDEFAEVTGTVTDVGCGGSVPLIVYRCPPGSEYPGGSEYRRRELFQGAWEHSYLHARDRRAVEAAPKGKPTLCRQLNGVSSMRPAEVIDAVKARLDSVGVPQHVRRVRRASPSVQVSVLLDGGIITLKMRSGITRMEMDKQLASLEAKWRAHKERPDF